MGSLILQVGQAGNQIGLKLWDELRSMHYSNTDFLFREGDTVTHSILVDTEPKVLRAIKHDRGTYFCYDPNNIVYYQYGRGNNWAMGYYNQKTGKTKAQSPLKEKVDSLSTLEKARLYYKLKNNEKSKPSPQKQTKKIDDDDNIMTENSVLLEHVNQLIQKEIERIDYYTSTMMIYSLAGGTGSGFGSRILETMRDEYSMNLLYNTVVFPSFSGENPLQQYNCLLSISHLQDFSDGIIYFQNDKIYRMLSRMPIADNTKPINMDDINDYCASLVANLLKVNDLKNSKRFYSDYLSDLCCMNECKFIELYGGPFNLRGKTSIGLEATWENIIDHTLSQSALDPDETASKQDAQSLSLNPSTLAAKCIIRSHDVDTTFVKNENTKKYLDKKIQSNLCPLKWNPDAVSHEFIRDKIKPTGDLKGMLVLANRVHIAGILKELSDIARSKYKARAYLHWYFKFGMEEEDFLRAFENIEMVIDNYSYLLN